MSRQDQINQIVQGLAQIGVSSKTGEGTDISIATEFLDAGWGSGNRKINYNAFIYFDESCQTVFMWELTKEVGSGFSFGAESQTSFQSGTTLFRKVKSIQYGIDGKAFEYTLDLGAIPKTVKETAKQNNWKFKIVINKNKALYPAGYIPSMVPPQQQTQYTQPQPTQPQSQFQQQPAQPQPQFQTQPAQPQPQYSNPQGQFYVSSTNKKNSNGGIFGLIGFILLGCIMIFMLSVAKSTITGWVISVILFAGAFIIQRKLVQKGCVLNLVLWILTGFILFITIVLTAQLT